MPMLTTLRDALAGVAVPRAGADRVGEGGHLVEDGVDFGHDVFAVDEDGFGFGRAQSDVEDGAVLGDVDLLAGEHGFGALRAGRILRRAAMRSLRVSSVMRFLE